MISEFEARSAGSVVMARPFVEASGVEPDAHVTVARSTAMHAFGSPGIAPTWTSSAKDMVGCSLGTSRVWFTTGYGILNEVYYPRIDIPQVRDLGFIVADGNGFWVEVKRLGTARTTLPAPGIPALDIVHTHPRFTLRLRIAPDPLRDALLIDLTLEGDASLRPYALLAPHLGGSGRGNEAQATTHGARRVLWAEQGPFGLALAAVDDAQQDAWGAISAGYVGASDGWQDFSQHGAMRWAFESAGPGNVALTGALPRRATLALGFGSSREAAATLAVSALCQPFDSVWASHVDSWQQWQRRVKTPPGLPKALATQFALSAMVLRVHQDKTFPGAMVASLSVPWGNTRDEIGGYHLVWPRDLVESAGALLAIGSVEQARNVMRYLIATQLVGGDWSQNQWLGGRPWWQGSQLDETAFPVLLAAALAEQDALEGIEVRTMVSAALSRLARNGPMTQQDRWEEDAGINGFTLSNCIAAMVAGARWLGPVERDAMLRLADDWNARIEHWTAVSDTALARKHRVPGYYMRIAPAAWSEAAGLPTGISVAPRDESILPIKNRSLDPHLHPSEQVATDFLQLVRMGLRDAADPLVRDTLKVIDGELEVDTPAGPVWHRYNGDGYGEHDDGGAFDGTGHGRGWPLLTGERGHLVLAGGEDPLPYLNAMAAMVGPCGMIPEQVWDGEPGTPDAQALGTPSGSAMPLVWAHAEFIKLALGRQLKRPCDRPSAVWARYHGKRPDPDAAIWMPRLPITRIHAGQTLWLYLPRPARVHQGVDGWRHITDIDTVDTTFGVHIARIESASFSAGSTIDFTCFWTDNQEWDGHDHRIDIVSPIVSESLSPAG